MTLKANALRSRLISQSEKRHGLIHLMFGLIAFFFGYNEITEPNSIHLGLLLVLAIMASFFPDLDHFLYIYIYGKKKNYAKNCRELIMNRNVKGFLEYVKRNHKNNTGIYTHNIGSVILTSFFTFYQLRTSDNIYMFVLFLAWTLHYIYDILEDILYFSKPNKNWFFVFNKK